MPTSVTDPINFPRAFEAALNAGDLEQVVALYEENATLRVPSGQTRTGADAVRTEMGQLIAANARISNTLRHALVSGSTALILVTYVLALTTPDGPAEVSGTATNVLRRDPQGSWRMAISNPQGIA